MTTLDRKTLSALDGKTILVTSALDRRNPPTGVRGTLRVVDQPESSAAKVEVELTYPDMFLREAHDRILVLTNDEIEQLLTREYRGAYELTVPYSLREDV
ncbi:MAG TPA: hypothetical protein VIM69_02360 [Opitutaceae bacterium]